MASSEEAVTLQIAALSAVHNEYADREKKELKRKLADTKECLNYTRDSVDSFAKSLTNVTEELYKERRELYKKRRKEDRTAVAMEDIKEHCQTSKALMDSIHDKLVDGFRSSDGIRLSQAEVWEMMRSIIEVSDRLTDIHEDAELREEPSSDEQ